MVQSYLQTVKESVSQLKDAGGKPLQIPHFSTLYAAAGSISPHSSDTVETIYLIQSLLGRASCVDFEVPATLTLPGDHHLHPSMGTEWYWVACHLNVTDQNNKTGRISVLVDMTRNRVVGQQAQKAAAWSDVEVTIANTVATVTVDMGVDEREIYRRSANAQWPLAGGSVAFSKPDEDFLFQCGSDILSGSANVLPLHVLVDDGDNMNISLTLTNGTGIDTDTAWFKQGVPTLGNGGNGITPVPTPGIYYSWPQLVVKEGGTVKVGGNTYTIQSGSGWIDHEIMMSSLENANGAASPIPFVDDPVPYNGWIWQFYNLSNGQSFTGAGFIQGEMNLSPAMGYGYFLQPDGKGGWTAIYISEGTIDLLAPRTFPAQVGELTSLQVVIPIERQYSGIENPLLGHPLKGTATPWYIDGTYNFPNQALCGEFPADYTDQSGEYANGLGYMESVGFQKVVDYQLYALEQLKGRVVVLEEAAKA